MSTSVKAMFLEIVMQALDDYLANLRKLDFHHLITYKDQNILGRADS